MKITFERQDSTKERWTGWHILTVAEAGFSMLDIYGRHQNGLDTDLIRQFADQVNQRDEAGSLYPRAPISALPNRFFREQEKTTDPAVLDAFKGQLVEFLTAARDSIRPKQMLIDFHVSPTPVPRRYIKATEEVLGLLDRHGSIEEIVIFT